MGRRPEPAPLGADRFDVPGPGLAAGHSGRKTVSQEDLPKSWNSALLAVIPGLFATMGWVSTDFSASMLAGLTLLSAFLVAAYWWNKRQLPAWSLMAAGMLTSVVLTIASGVIGGLAAILVGESANVLVLLVLMATLVALLWFSLRARRVPLLVWALFTAVAVCQLVVRVKYFAQFGVSWSVAGQWLSISLYAVVIALLLPIALGLCLAQRYGLSTMLFLIGMVYVGFQILIDVNYKVSDQMGDTLGFVAYKALIPLLFTVITPLWFLRARSGRSRVGGVLALVGLAVMLDLVVVGLSYGGDLPPIIWISFIPYTISVLLTVALAYLLYRERGGRLTPA
jgi:hypothetical protein